MSQDEKQQSMIPEAFLDYLISLSHPIGAENDGPTPGDAWEKLNEQARMGELLPIITVALDREFWDAIRHYLLLGQVKERVDDFFEKFWSDSSVNDRRIALFGRRGQERNLPALHLLCFLLKIRDPDGSEFRSYAARRGYRLWPDLTQRSNPIYPPAESLTPDAAHKLETGKLLYELWRQKDFRCLQALVDQLKKAAKEDLPDATNDPPLEPGELRSVRAWMNYTEQQELDVKRADEGSPSSANEGEIQWTYRSFWCQPTGKRKFSIRLLKAFTDYLRENKSIPLGRNLINILKRQGLSSSQVDQAEKDLPAMGIPIYMWPDEGKG